MAIAILSLAGELLLADVRSIGTKQWAQRRGVARQLFFGLLSSCDSVHLASNRLTLPSSASRVAGL